MECNLPTIFSRYFFGRLGVRMLAMLRVLRPSNSNSHHQDDPKYALGDRESQPTEPGWSLDLRYVTQVTYPRYSSMSMLLQAFNFSDETDYLDTLLILVEWLIWSYQHSIALEQKHEPRIKTAGFLVVWAVSVLYPMIRKSWNPTNHPIGSAGNQAHFSATSSSCNPATVPFLVLNNWWLWHRRRGVFDMWKLRKNRHLQKNHQSTNRTITLPKKKCNHPFAGSQPQQTSQRCSPPSIRKK